MTRTTDTADQEPVRSSKPRKRGRRLLIAILVTTPLIVWLGTVATLWFAMAYAPGAGPFTTCPEDVEPPCTQPGEYRSDDVPPPAVTRSLSANDQAHAAMQTAHLLAFAAAIPACLALGLLNVRHGAAIAFGQGLFITFAYIMYDGMGACVGPVMWGLLFWILIGVGRAIRGAVLGR